MKEEPTSTPVESSYCAGRRPWLTHDRIRPTLSIPEIVSEKAAQTMTEPPCSRHAPIQDYKQIDKEFKGTRRNGISYPLTL